ncbi:MAG: outer membrane beta-barrel domain-containing protein [Bdellovibrionota bacterium]
MRPDPYKHIIGGNLVWAPIYGKFSIFSKRFFTSIFAQLPVLVTTWANENNFGFNVGIGTKVFVNDWAAVRVDLRNFTVKEGAPFNQHISQNNRILSLGMSFFLPSMVEREQ